MLIGQFDIKSQQYIVVLTILIVIFFICCNSKHQLKYRHSWLVAIMLITFYNLLLFQKDINIYKVGNVLVALFLSFLVNRFIIIESFQENIYYVSYLYLLLLFLKTLATYFAVQFSNFQFFNFFIVSIVFILE